MPLPTSKYASHDQLKQPNMRPDPEPTQLPRAEGITSHSVLYNFRNKTWYRVAGFREPRRGEHYLSPGGLVLLATYDHPHTAKFASARVILREVCRVVRTKDAPTPEHFRDILNPYTNSQE